MLAKSLVFLSAAAALGGEAVAFNVNRVPQEKRDVAYAHTDYKYFTTWVTVTVYDDGSLSTGLPSTPVAHNPKPTHLPKEGGQSDKGELHDPNILLPIDSSPADSPAPTQSDTQVTTELPTAPPTESQPETIPTYSPEPVPEPEPKPAPTSTLSSAPVPSPVPAPVPAPAPVPGSGSGKRGIAYNDAKVVDAFFGPDAYCESCGFSWNWDSSSNDLTNKQTKFIPTLWSPKEIHTSRWDKNVQEMIAQGSTNLFSFNECDNASQCNTSPAEAAAAHAKYMNPYGGQAKIGSPSITNSGNPGQGLDWLRTFLDSCKQVDCQIDFCVTHWYSPVDAADTLFSHLTKVHELCDGKPVWLTEFAPLSEDVNEIDAFLKDVIPRLDSSEFDFVHGYSYFMATPGKLLTSATSLSQYGRTYATA